MTQWRDCDGKSGVYAGNLALILCLTWTKGELRPTQNNAQKAHFRIAFAPEHHNAGVWLKCRRFSRFRVPLTTHPSEKMPYKLNFARS